MPRKLIAELILDPSQYIKGLRKATRASEEFAATQKRTLGQVGRGVGSKTGALGAIGGGFLGGGVAVGAGILAGEITQGIEASVAAASDLNEQMSKTTVVFGQASAGVKEWATTTTQGFGIAQREALQTASSFGALFAPVGLLGQKSAEQSEKLTQLGADLASFYNTDVQQALDAIRSGLVGEERPLRDYGVRLSAARVQQQALTDTGKKHAKQLTDLDKTMARIKIIFQDTKQAQGDYARTSENLANQTRTLKANLDDLSTGIGKTLIPAFTNATGAANDFFQGLAGKGGQGGGTARDVGEGAKQGKNLFERVNNWLPDALKAQNVFKTAVTRFGPQAFPILFWQVIGKVFGDEPKKAGKAIMNPEAAVKMRHGIELVAEAAAAATNATKKFKPTVEQRNLWFDQMISRQQLRAGLLTGINAQLAAYQKVSDELTKQIAAVNDITRKNKLIDELLQNNATIVGLQAQRAANIKQAQDEAAQKRKDAIAAAKQEHEDWLDFAYEKAQTTKTMKDDVKTARAALAYWTQQVNTGKRTVEEARKQLYWQGQLKDALKQGRDTDPLAGLMQVSSARLASILAAGTGLSAQGRAILGANIAGAEIQPLHVHVNIDGREVGRAVTADQARTSKRTASQTSGRRG